MPGQPLERLAGEPGKESFTFPNAELGARLLQINGRSISVLPQSTPTFIGKTYLGPILSPNGWLERYKDDADWHTPGDVFKVKVSTNSGGERSFYVLPTDDTSRNGLIVERLHVNEKTKDIQWEEVNVSGEKPGFPGFFASQSAYWPEWPEGGLPKSIPTVTLPEIIRVSRREEIQHFLFEATFASIPNKTGNLENCNASSSYQPIEEPVVLEK